MKEQIKKSVICQRLNSDTPPFFKKLRKYAFFGTVILSGVGAFFATGGLAVPLWVTGVVTALNSMCLSAMGVSSLATSDGELSKK